MEKRTEKNKQLYEYVQKQIQDNSIKNDEIFIQKGHALEKVMGNEQEKISTKKEKNNSTQKFTLFLTLIMILIIIVLAVIIICNK